MMMRKMIVNIKKEFLLVYVFIVKKGHKIENCYKKIKESRMRKQKRLERKRTT